MVVLYIGIMKVWRFCPKLSPQNQLDICFLTVWEYWLGLAKPKNVFRSTLSHCIKLLWNFKNFLFNRFFCWLTDWLMPSDKRNSIMALATGSIFSLLRPEMCLFANRSSSSAHIMVLLKITFVLLCTPFLSPLARRWRFAVRALWLRCETRVSGEPAGSSRGASNVILCLERCPARLPYARKYWRQKNFDEFSLEQIWRNKSRRIAQSS